MIVKNLSDVIKELNLINDSMEKFDTDERKEIKKNNKLIDSYILELEQIKDVILNELRDRYQTLIPSSDNLNLDNSDQDIIFENVKYLSNGSYLYKMDIDKNMHEIRYGNSLDVINNNILDLMGKFLLVGVNITNEDFKYSLSLYKYMSSLIDNKDSEEFNVRMRDVFDSLYWECPNLVHHIYLCFSLLLDKYKDKFDTYIKNKCSFGNGYEEELKKFLDLVIVKNEEKMTSKYLNYQCFLNGELRIEDYLDGSTNKKEIISKFIDYDKYVSLDIDGRYSFYNQIKNIYDDLCECLLINKYSYLIEKVKEIYLNKNNYLSNYSSLIKNLKSLDKQREKLVGKLYFVYNKMNSKNSNRLLKKYNNLFNKVNSKIDEIISNYENYDETLFINDVITKLNDDSTYYDVFKLFESNYSYLVSFMKDKDGNYNEYIDFLYSPYLNISKSIPFISNVNIENKLLEKYELFDININLSDKNKLKEELKYIIRLEYFEKGNIDLREFKLIFDIKKIIEN